MKRWTIAASIQANGRCQSRPGLLAAGVSLGGNALMRWAGEHGHSAQKVVNAVASICSPLDLTASGHAIGKGFNRQVYTRMFLRSMKPKAMAKLKQFPGLFDANKLLAAQDLYEFDDVFTAPLHGFKNTDDYWLRASALSTWTNCIASIGTECHERPLYPFRQLANFGKSQCSRHTLATRRGWPCWLCKWFMARAFESHARGCRPMVVAAHPLRSKAWTILSDKPWPRAQRAQLLWLARLG